MKVRAEIVLVAGALACFCAFAALRYGLGGEGEARAVMAEVSSGAPRVRAWGETVYATRSPGDPIYELDLVWAQEKEGAVLELKRGGFLELPVGSLVVMKRPFRQGLLENESAAGSPPFRKLSGNPQVAEARPETSGGAVGSAPKDSPQAEAVPSARPSSPTLAPTAIRAQNLYPAPGATFFLVDKDSSRVTFSWDPGLGARQWVLNGQTHEVVEGAASSQPQTIQANPPEWIWELRNAQGQVVSGPHRFRVQRLKRADLDQAISAAGLEATFYIE